MVAGFIVSSMVESEVNDHLFCKSKLRLKIHHTCWMECWLSTNWLSCTREKTPKTDMHTVDILFLWKLLLQIRKNTSLLRVQVEVWEGNFGKFVWGKSLVFGKKYKSCLEFPDDVAWSWRCSSQEPAPVRSGGSYTWICIAPETNSSPLKIGRAPKGISSSKCWFSGAMLQGSNRYSSSAVRELSW